MQVFVDASVYVAIRNKNDSNHKKALILSQELFQKKAEFITSNIVIYEVYTVLSMKIDKATALGFHDRILKENLPIIYMTEELEEEAWRMFEKEKSKNVSYFDFTSFAIIKNLKIKSMFSFDKDFKRFAKREGLNFNLA